MSNKKTYLCFIKFKGRIENELTFIKMDDETISIYTKEQRHKVYKWALIAAYRVDLNSCILLCNLTNKACLYLGFSFKEEVIKDFPELYIHNNGCLFWFPINEEGRKKRFDILKQAIIETL